jgi:predicted Zn-dependent protease
MSEDLTFELSFFESLHRREPNSLKVTEILAHLYTQTGQISNGLKMDRKLVRLNPDNPTARYNLACSLALKGRKKEAVETLEVAFELGYKDYAWLMQDTDLECLHNYGPFQELLRSLPLPNLTD